MLRDRAFAFLACLRCDHFVPKNPTMRHEAALVGFCAGEEVPQQVKWVSLERAAQGQAACPDRQPATPIAPRCPLFEVTTESAGHPYPAACVHYGVPACPL